MRQNLMIITAVTLMVFFTSPAIADIIVNIVDESSLPYNLSPNKYDNSPNKYDNSPNKYDNSSNKYDNSSNKYDNSPSKYSNTASGDKRLLLKSDGKLTFVGYYTRNGSITNFFSPKGTRLFYNPPGTDSVFEAEGGEFSGVFVMSDGSYVLGLTKNGLKSLLLAD